MRRGFTRYALTVMAVTVFFCGVPAQHDAAAASVDGELSKIERAMLTEGDFQASAGKLERIAAEDPGNTRVLVDLGIAYYGDMRYAKASEAFRAALGKKMPADREKFVRYAVTRIDENRAILEQIEKLKDTAPGGSRDETMFAVHFTVLNELLRGEYYYPSIIMPHIIWLKKNMSEMPGIYKLSGDVYYSALMYRQAAEDYEKAIEDDPDNAALRQRLADCQVAMGDYESAQESYGEAVEIYRRDEGGTFEGEIQEITRIREALPLSYKDISELIRDKKYWQAEEICKQRVSLNPGDYVAITQLGQVYWQQQKRRAAIRLFRKAIRMAPDYPTAHFFLGRAYIFERKPDKGMKQFDIFKEKMELLPEMDEDTVDSYVAQLHYIAYIYATLKKYDDVMRECNKILSLRPDDQKAHYNIAVCYYVGYNNRSRAYAELRKVIDADPNTRIGDMARYYIDYIRRNPDSRIIGDFGFLEER